VAHVTQLLLMLLLVPTPLLAQQCYLLLPQLLLLLVLPNLDWYQHLPYTVACAILEATLNVDCGVISALNAVEAQGNSSYGWYDKH
jgi:hypothetical protein